MEVHKHPHHVTHKKKWGEYLLEFFMLFLAVFLGFVAENKREHIVEDRKEHEYMRSMVEDLRKDSAYLQVCIDKYIPQHIRLFDSTLSLLKQPDLQPKSKELYQAFFTATMWVYNYIPTQRTLSQLKNNGFYLVRNSHVADVLSELDIDYTVYLARTNFVHEMQHEIDRSSFVFADRDIVNTIRTKQFSNYHYSDMKASYGEFSVIDLPASAPVKIAGKEALDDFIKKIETYSYYLSTSLRAEYFRIIRTIHLTKTTLEKEYHL